MLLNDNAPDSELSDVTGLSPLGWQQFLISNVVVKVAPIGTRTRFFHSRVRRFAGLSIPGRDIDFMSCSVFICALCSLYSALNLFI